MFELILFLFLPIFGSISSSAFPEVLSQEEESELLKLSKLKNKEARDKLIEHNMRLVAYIVRKFDNYKDEKDDLLSVGAFGLIKAIDTYKLDSEVRLATYAARCIENEILMYIRTNKKHKSNTSIYASIGTDKDGNEIRIMDVIVDPTPATIENLVNDENISTVTDALKILNDRELEVLEKRFGINGKVILTQKEISDELNISRSYVSRIEKRALTKLYLYIKNKK